MAAAAGGGMAPMYPILHTERGVFTISSVNKNNVLPLYYTIYKPGDAATRAEFEAVYKLINPTYKNFNRTLVAGTPEGNAPVIYETFCVISGTEIPRVDSWLIAFDLKNLHNFRPGFGHLANSMFELWSFKKHPKFEVFQGTLRRRNFSLYSATAILILFIQNGLIQNYRGAMIWLVAFEQKIAANYEQHAVFNLGPSSNEKPTHMFSPLGTPFGLERKGWSYIIPVLVDDDNTGWSHSLNPMFALPTAHDTLKKYLQTNSTVKILCHGSRYMTQEEMMEEQMKQKTKMQLNDEEQNGTVVNSNEEEEDEVIVEDTPCAHERILGAAAAGGGGAAAAGGGGAGAAEHDNYPNFILPQNVRLIVYNRPGFELNTLLAAHLLTRSTLDKNLFVNQEKPYIITMPVSRFIPMKSDAINLVPPPIPTIQQNYISKLYIREYKPGDLVPNQLLAFETPAIEMQGIYAETGVCDSFTKVTRDKLTDLTQLTKQSSLGKRSPFFTYEDLVHFIGRKSCNKLVTIHLFSCSTDTYSVPELAENFGLGLKLNDGPKEIRRDNLLLSLRAANLWYIADPTTPLGFVQQVNNATNLAAFFLARRNNLLRELQVKPISKRYLALLEKGPVGKKYKTRKIRKNNRYFFEEQSKARRTTKQNAARRRALMAVAAAGGGGGPMVNEDTKNGSAPANLNNSMSGRQVGGARLRTRRRKTSQF
jgi:hypothetical protein